MAKWRLFETGILERRSGKLVNYLGKYVYISFINNSGTADVTIAYVGPYWRKTKNKYCSLVGAFERNYAKIPNGELLAWKPATIPEPFVPGKNESEWVTIDTELPKFGKDVFVTIVNKDGEFFVDHARLNVVGGIDQKGNNKCGFYNSGSCQYIGTPFSTNHSDDKILAWRYAKLPKPFDVSKMGFIFR